MLRVILVNSPSGKIKSDTQDEETAVWVGEQGELSGSTVKEILLCTHRNKYNVMLCGVNREFSVTSLLAKPLH